MHTCTHARTHKHRAGKKLVWGQLSYLSCDASYSSLQLTESLAFRSHRFYQHICAESTLEIIYGFKNTVIVHSFGVILLNLFWALLIHPKALNWMWRQYSLERVGECVCLCVLDGWLGGDWFGSVETELKWLPCMNYNRRRGHCDNCCRSGCTHVVP